MTTIPTATEVKNSNDHLAKARKGLAGSTLLMMGGLLGSRIAGFIRERVIAHQFGQGFYTDIYSGSFTIPDLIFFLIAGGALSSAFLPVFSEYINTDREKEAWRIFSAVSIIMFVIISALIILGEIFAYKLVLLTNPGFALVPHKIEDTVRLTRILLPAQLCFFLGGIMMATLTARHIFTGQIVGPIIYNIGIILGGIFLTRRYGVAGLCYGAISGALIGNLLMQWVLVRRSGGYFVWRGITDHFLDPGVKKVFKLMIPVLLGLALPQVSIIITKIFASDLGNGPQSAIMNANKLMHVPISLFGQAAALAIFPLMAAQAARKEMAALRASVNLGIRTILFMSIPASLILFLLALPIVQFLLQTGKYTFQDALIAAATLRCFSVGVFAWSALAIIARGFYAIQDSRTPVIVGTIVSFIFIGLNFGVRSFTGTTDTTLAVEGLALTTSIAAIMHMSIMFYFLRRRLRGILGGKLVFSISRTLAGSLVAGLICYLLLHSMQNSFERLNITAQRHNPNYHIPVTAQAFFILMACILASGAAYLFMAFLMRMEEVNLIRRIIRKLFGGTNNRPAPA